MADSPKKIYEELCGLGRETFLSQARENERMTLNVGNGECMIASQTRDMWNCWQDLGIECVKSMGAMLYKTMFPPIPWIRLSGFGPEYEQNKVEIDQILTEIDSRRVPMKFEDTGMNSGMYQAINGVLVSGQVLFHAAKGDDKGGTVDPMDRRDYCQQWPLKCFAVERRDGRIIRVAVCTRSKDWAGSPALAAATMQEDEYYCIDYEAKLVYKQVGDDWRPLDPERENIKQWAVFTLEPPVLGSHYATAFVTQSYRKLLSVNGLEKAKLQIAYKAAQINPYVKRSSGIEPGEYAKLQTGQPIELNDADDVGYISLQGKIPDLSIIENIVLEQSNQLRSTFLFGLMNRQIEPKTATLVRQLVSEMTAQGAQHFAHACDSIQRPVADMVLHLIGFNPDSDPRLKNIKVNILTGLSAFSRQEEAQTIITLLDPLLKMWPELRNVLDPLKTLSQLGSGYGVNFGSLQKATAGVQQLLLELADAVQNDPQARQMVAATLAKIIPEGMPENEQKVVEAAGSVPDAVSP